MSRERRSNQEKQRSKIKMKFNTCDRSKLGRFWEKIKNKSDMKKYRNREQRTHQSTHLA